MSDKTADPLQEQQSFPDAIFNDPEMTLEQKVHWLHITAVDYLGRLDVAEAVVEAVRLVGGLDNESSGYAIVARMRSIAHALAAYDTARGGSE